LTKSSTFDEKTVALTKNGSVDKKQVQVQKQEGGLDASKAGRRTKNRALEGRKQKG
jgi:hypothetical protein